METPNLLIVMPSDDELYTAFIDAIKNGVHENIKGIADKLSGYIEKAKDELKNLVVVDPANGLALDMTIEKGDKLLDAFVAKQSRLMRNALKILLSTQGISSFTNFVNKMKADPASAETTIGTLSKIMTIFFTNLGVKYLTKETEETIKGKISLLFK